MTGKGQSNPSFHLLSLFLIWLGMGFLVGITGSVIAAPNYAPPDDREAKLVYASGLQPQNSADAPSGTSGEESSQTAKEGELFLKKGCTQCHEVSYYGIAGGVTGPDLTKAHWDVPDRFGKTLAEFLQEPEGTMAEMFARMDISEEEKAQVLELLTKAGEAARQPNSPEDENTEDTDGPE
ncbi:Cytochrome c [Desulfitobacterium hafniense]|uniref:Cytochrome c n=1 Tax=Desulfitobacterium hafniense TaxID=49338 RepID=A0A098AVU7_DESHA|nr:cytochrome C [Desulfitobacterium hafniense]CDX00245.1 Cytochrome c [Desulfitobacterium hafniense]